VDALVDGGQGALVETPAQGGLADENDGDRGA
jgi:hypothetical protein